MKTAAKQLFSFQFSQINEPARKSRQFFRGKVCCCWCCSFAWHSVGQGCGDSRVAQPPMLPSTWKCDFGRFGKIGERQRGEASGGWAFEETQRMSRSHLMLFSDILKIFKWFKGTRKKAIQEPPHTFQLFVKVWSSKALNLLTKDFFFYELSNYEMDFFFCRVCCRTQFVGTIW